MDGQILLVIVDGQILQVAYDRILLAADGADGAENESVQILGETVAVVMTTTTTLVQTDCWLELGQVVSAR